MPTLVRNKAFALVDEPIPSVNRSTLPPNWVSHLQTKLEVLLRNERGVTTFDSQQFQDKTRLMNDDLNRCLAVIYTVLNDAEVTEDQKKSIASKLDERVRHCTQGFHTGVRSMLEGLTLPKSLDDLLYRVRKDMVGTVAHRIAVKTSAERGSDAYEVHDENYIYIHTKDSFGVHPPNPHDTMLSPTLRTKIDNGSVTRELQATFKPFKAFFVLDKIYERLLSCFYNADYVGPRDADESYTTKTIQACGDVIANIFSDWDLAQERTTAINEKKRLEAQLKELEAAQLARENTAIGEATTQMQQFLDGLCDENRDSSATLPDGVFSVKQQQMRGLFTNADGTEADLLDPETLKTQLLSITDAFANQQNNNLMRHANLTQADINWLTTIRSLYKSSVKRPDNERLELTNTRERITALEEGSIKEFNNAIFKQAPIPQNWVNAGMEEADWDPQYIDIKLDKVRWKLLEKMVRENYITLSDAEHMAYTEHCGNIDAIGEQWLINALSNGLMHLQDTELSSFLSFFSGMSLLRVMSNHPTLSDDEKPRYLEWFVKVSPSNDETKKAVNIFMLENQMAALLSKVNDKKEYYQREVINPTLANEFENLYNRLNEAFTTYQNSARKSADIETATNAWKAEFATEDTQNLMNTHRAWGWSVTRDLLVIATLVGILVRAIQYAVGARHTIFISKTNTAESVDSIIDKFDAVLPTAH